MKKILFGLLAIAGGLLSTSCSNDEIAIVQSPTIINVNTSNVMSFYRLDDFVNAIEADRNDIDILPSSYRLRVRNMVYNEKGTLVYDKYTFHRNYINNVRDELMLPNGEYKVMTITDVVGVDGNENINFRYWNVKDSVRLSTAKIEETGYIGHSKNVVSAVISDIVVDGNEHVYNFSPRPLGSLMYIFYANIHGNSNVSEIGLYTKKIAKNVSIPNNEYVVNYDAADKYKWRYDILTPSEYNKYQNIYSWSFALATDNAPVAFLYKDTNGKNWYFNDVNMDIKAGDFIVAYCDISTIDSDKILSYITTADDFLTTLGKSKQQIASFNQPMHSFVTPKTNETSCIKANNAPNSVSFKSIEQRQAQ